MSRPGLSGAPLARALRGPRPPEPRPPAPAAPSTSLNLAPAEEPRGAHTPSSARRPARPALPGPAPPRRSRPPSSSRASLVITSGLPPRAAPVVRGRPQACVGGRPETPRAPGRAPGSRVQAALQAAPLAPVRACGSPPRSPRGEGSPDPTRPAPGNRWTRRLPQHTPVQSHQSRTADGAATPARARRPPSAPPRGPLGPGPAYRSCRSGSAALGPHDCPRLPSRVLRCPRRPALREKPPPWCRPAPTAALPPA